LALAAQQLLGRLRRPRLRRLHTQDDVLQSVALVHLEGLVRSTGELGAVDGAFIRQYHRGLGTGFAHPASVAFVVVPAAHELLLQKTNTLPIPPVIIAEVVRDAPNVRRPALRSQGVQGVARLNVAAQVGVLLGCKRG